MMKKRETKTSSFNHASPIFRRTNRTRSLARSPFSYSYLLYVPTIPHFLAILVECQSVTSWQSKHPRNKSRGICGSLDRKCLCHKSNRDGIRKASQVRLGFLGGSGGITAALPFVMRREELLYGICK